MSDLVDQVARREAVERVERSFAMSAGAGAGKTRVLVDRLVQHLMAGTPPRSIAAITFTRAAANELLSRSRDAIEERLSTARGPEVAQLEKILSEFGELTLSTIHSFCQDLLRQEALEARWAPDTEVAGALGAGALEGVYARWRVGFDARHPDEATLIVSGWANEVAHYYGTPSIRGLADMLLENRDLEPVVADPAPLDWEEGRRALSSLVGDLGALRGRCRNPDQCKLLAASAGMLAELERLMGALEDARGCVMAALAVKAAKGGRLGTAKDWAPADKEAFHGGLKGFEAWQSAWSGHVGAQIHRALVADLRVHYLPLIQQARLDRGQADFADLLFRSKALLKEHPEARRRLSERYEVLLIDEVQDTDPIQAEVAALLTRPPEAKGPWHAIAPAPGSLFAVGDPKQSIYRFRRADVQVWHQLRAMIGLEGASLQLTQNFRSVPGLVAWTNAAFAAMPDFEAQQAHRPPASLDPVVVINAEDPNDEIDGLVRHLRSLRDSGAEVVDGATGALRPLRDSDFLILIPSWTKALIIQDALLLAGIECTVEGGAGFFERDEIRLALAAMRAIEEPTDGESIVFVLRGLFGVSFEELAAHKRAGGWWSYLHPSPPAGPVADALRHLRFLHVERQRQSWVGLLDDLLEHTGVAAVWALMGRRWSILANLDKLRSLIRQIEPTTRSSSEVIEALEALKASGSEDLSRVDEDSHAARVMTYFKAKGLEAPVVALVCAARKEASVQSAIRRGEQGDQIALKAGASVVPPGWDAYEAAEKAEEREERRRWMYVATTRARDQLVLIRSPKGSGLYDCDVAAMMGSPAGDLDGQLQEVAPGVAIRAHLAGSLPEVRPDLSTFSGLDARVDALLADEGARGGDPEGERRQQRALGALSASRRASTRWRSVGNLNRRHPVEFEGGGVGPRGGKIVHATMEHLDLSLPQEALLPRVPGLVRAFGAMAGLDEALLARCEQVVLRLLELPVIQEAREAPERWREVPFAYPERGLIVAGQIDLCFPTNKKRTNWKVVDWKSHLPPRDSDLHAIYRNQLAYYTRALLATVTPCQQVEAILAGPHHEIGEADWLGEKLDIVHAYLTGLVMELVSAGAEPEVGVEPEMTPYVQLELAWPDRRLGLGLDLSEAELGALEREGWQVASVDTSVASWPELAAEVVFDLLGLSREDAAGGEP